MLKIIVPMAVALLLIACSKQDGGVTGSEPKEILDGVQVQLDAAADAEEERLKDAMVKINAQ